LVEIYAPRGQDPPPPHTRDEAYIVRQGSGEFINGGSVTSSDAAISCSCWRGVEHRFENFTDDLITWVIFYGPEGGET
jgi:mannose-6-phosphate isomerase-like protein (cupin superfamily)